MSPSPQPATLQSRLRSLEPAQAEYATEFVDELLRAACQVGASDVHLQPEQNQLGVKWRLDGVLQTVGKFPRGRDTDVVARLKVLAGLLTYRTEVPQEGRLKFETDATAADSTQHLAGQRSSDRLEVEMRVSSFPTIDGERAVVRLFASVQRRHLNQLGLSDEIATKLRALLGETTGSLLIAGPAGSGKTTTAYACLRQLVQDSQGGRSLVSLEDPVESRVPGVAQSQIQPAQEFDFHTGLRSLLRQDPEVILVGEIRDAETAAIAFQAGLTGQLMLTTFHSGSAAAALHRLLDMGVEPYLLRSGTLGILHQRLVRQLCACAVWSNNDADKLGLPVSRTKLPTGCPLCGQTGFAGRALLYELLCPRELPGLAAQLNLQQADQLENVALAGGMKSRWQLAAQYVEAAVTSAAEVRRVLGFGEPLESLNWSSN